MISKSNSKSCDLDPIPTWLLKQCIPSLAPVITNIINQSLSSAMPTTYKKASITPVLKKKSSPEKLKNYRAISNLSFISNLIEKVAAKQLTTYISTHNLDELM